MMNGTCISRTYHISQNIDKIINYSLCEENEANIKQIAMGLLPGIHT